MYKWRTMFYPTTFNGYILKKKFLLLNSNFGHYTSVSRIGKLRYYDVTTFSSMTIILSFTFGAGQAVAAGGSGQTVAAGGS